MVRKQEKPLWYESYVGAKSHFWPKKPTNSRRIKLVSRFGATSNKNAVAEIRPGRVAGRRGAPWYTTPHSIVRSTLSFLACEFV